MSGTVTPSYGSAAFLGPNPGLARLYDNVQATVPAVQFPLVQLEVWNIIEDFYIKSTWRRENLSWSLAPGDQVVDFNPFSAVWLVSDILNVTGLHRFRIIPPGQLIDASIEGFDGTSDSSTADESQRFGTCLVSLKPVSLAAINNSGFVDDSLFSKWFETLLDGVYWKLYSMPAKPWSSPQTAQYHGARYRRGIAAARGMAQTFYSGGAGSRWNFPYFAAGRRKN
jgi:hypothetical protein